MVERFRQEFKAGHVAACATWSTFADISQRKPSNSDIAVWLNLPVHPAKASPRDALLETLYETTTRLDDEDVHDLILACAVARFHRNWLRSQAFYLLVMEETDNWAHAGRCRFGAGPAYQFDLFRRTAFEHDAGDAAVSRRR